MTTWSKQTPIEVPAKPSGLWTLALDFVAKGALLKFEAGSERWYYAQAETHGCGADGDPASLLSRKGCLVASAPVGALIGKIGGSSAGIADGTLFVIGNSCTLQAGADVEGPLFVTINDESSGMSNNRGSISLTVSLGS